MAAAISPLVVSGPSGVHLPRTHSSVPSSGAQGKSTLLRRLFDKYPSAFGFSVSHTTRSPRPGEEDGKAYYFVTRDAFDALVAANAFIEHTTFSSNSYGTSFDTVRRVQEAGRICVLDVEMKGVQAIKNTSLNAKFVFIRPPSIADLEKRLRGRGTETEESLAKRIGSAAAEIAYAETGAHDKIVVNGESEDAAFAELDEYVRSTWPQVLGNAQQSLVGKEQKAGKHCILV
ncbi:hypothetical protein HDU83_003670 [Entophlyctis luteolus]|nr:hypothetical protein HDU82_009133 [Entophlyctis luteolus]KAJ3345854.1 hypothetical protein HDU83_003670 [Entophlyctis luteolus]KAJ3384078.1 hypothetical protein HDU84_003200 [Entophlyctis sp. JEL0112]